MTAIAPATPDADLDALRLRYIPQPGEEVTEDEIRQRGADLVTVARYSFILLGELVDWVFQHEQADGDASRRAIVLSNS